MCEFLTLTAARAQLTSKLSAYVAYIYVNFVSRHFHFFFLNGACYIKRREGSENPPKSLKHTYLPDGRLPRGHALLLMLA